MYKYHCLNNISKKGLANFDKNFEETDNINEADGLILRSAKIHDMEFSPKLACISRAGVGVNNVPVDKCSKLGIPVFNTPGGNANAVKELVVAGMLIASRDIVGGFNWVKENGDNPDIKTLAEKEKKRFAGKELSGKKLGIIGLGSIGTLIANAAYALGMDVYGYDPYLSVKAAWQLNQNVHHAKDINELYTNCDFITIHIPYLPSTEHTIDAKAISMMKKGTVVLNFSRDKLVDEEEIVKDNNVSIYVTDFANPIVASNPKCIVTPHLGASTEESEDNCAKMAVDNISEYLETGNISHSVNYPVLNMGHIESAERLCILHENKANMINQFTDLVGQSEANIAKMGNASKGDVAYTIIDLDSKIPERDYHYLDYIEGVYKYRFIH